MSDHQPPEPWHSFLLELEANVPEEVDFQCLSGFVITQLYGLRRPTADFDVLSIAPVEQLKPLIEKAGKNSELHLKHKIHLDYVGIVSVPYDYDTRLIEMYPETYKRLRLFALEPHDLVLTKLSRNIARDREDVRYLAKTIPLNLELLQERYRNEFRPHAIGNPENLDDIFRLWLEVIEEDRSSRR